jgi:hypothetical protein
MIREKKKRDSMIGGNYKIDLKINKMYVNIEFLNVKNPN